MDIKLSKIKKAYFIGIKGAGMVAVVEFFLKRGVEVSGSDTHEVFFTDKILQKLGVKYAEGFSEKNIPDEVDLVVYSTAYSVENNAELKFVSDKKILTISYPEALALLFNEKYGIAVCGTHGKTTTTAMLGMALEKAADGASAIVGSEIINWKSNALVGDGEYFALEADEYQNKLEYYQPKSVILTSVDYDHPDFFETFDAYKNAFKKFVEKISHIGNLVVWGDSRDTLEVSKNAKCSVSTYGFLEENDYRIFNFQFSILNQKPISKFQIKNKGVDLGEFEINLPGKHNVLNAAAVIAMCHRLNLDLDKVREGLAEFQGTRRRFEIVGERNGAILVDDYAHHPEEIKATLKAARELYPSKNIIVVFHPHTFTRTKALLQEFAQSFDDANKVILLDIYGSAREQQGGVSSSDLEKLINKYSRDKAEHVPTIDETVEKLHDAIGPNDLVISMGAGNVWEVVDKLKQ